MISNDINSNSYLNNMDINSNTYLNDMNLNDMNLNDINLNKINLNTYLNRDDKYQQIKSFLKDFELNRNDLTIKRGLYIYGKSGVGKTTFIINILNELGYDPIRYDAGDIRSKGVIETITKHNMSDKNILSMYQNKIKKIVIVMDEIDGMNNGDKGGINSLIKIIRPKKTKKQRLEESTSNPIICIGNYYIDKKIKELMKVCHTIELKIPTNIQMINITNSIILNSSLNIINNIVEFVSGDLRKLFMIYEIYNKNPKLISNIKELFLEKYYNDDTRQITKKLLNNNYTFNDHFTIMNETDRTIVGLLWHENIIDVISKFKKSISIPFYLKILNNICLSDYIDRITFQKQIWQFNEMTSLIKTFKNNKIYHELFKKKYKYNPTEVRFTKVLTKYSTEFNNTNFIQNLCQQLGMDKKDLLIYFSNLKDRYSDNEIVSLFENYEITKLDINRIYKYIDKYTKENMNDDIDDNENLEDDD
jgi:DNA polymerase III delta prime subunit